MIRRFLAGLTTLAVLLSGIAVYGQTEPPAQPATPEAIKNDLVAKQEQLARQFREFSSALLRLALRLERSDKVEEKERAKALRRAIELAEKEGVENQFTKLITILTKSNAVTSTELTQAVGQNEQLVKALREILAILLTDDESARLRAEIVKTQELLKEIGGLIRETKISRAVNEAAKGDPKKNAKDQQNIANKTADLAKKMGGDPKRENKTSPENKDAKDAKDAKAEGKPAGEKSDGDKGKSKEDADSKGSEKDPKGADGEPMKSDPKDGKEGASKAPPKEGEEAGGKGKGEPKMGEPKESPQGAPKAGPPKEGSPMEGSPMPMPPMPPMNGEAKAGPPSESKGKGQGKGEAKPGKPGKSGEASQAKSDGQPMPMQQSAQGEPKSGGQQGQPSPPQQANNKPQPPKQPEMPGKKQVEDAIPNQDNAAEKIAKNDREDATKEQTDAIKKLESARQELERRLKQLREEELERLLANLEARVNNLLVMQIEVYEGTKQVNASVQKNENKEPARNDAQKSLQLADREGKIVEEADKAIKLLENEGTAVAFPQVFEEVKRDMIQVQRRLAVVRVDEDTQAIEEDIIAALKEMIAALKKAQQDLKNKPSDPSQSPPNPNQPKQLIDQLAELKMIRNLQARVNDRTTKYGAKYQGEQADDGIIKNELRDLSDRQERVRDMLKDIATGKNQ